MTTREIAEAIDSLIDQRVGTRMLFGDDDPKLSTETIERTISKIATGLAEHSWRANANKPVIPPLRPIAEERLRKRVDYLESVLRKHKIDFEEVPF